MNASPAILLTTISGSLVFGMVVALVGSLRAAWRERLQILPARAEALWASFHWNLIPLILLGGILTDWWGLRFSLMLGSVLITLSLWLLCSAQTYNGTRTLLIVTSGGAALLGTAALIYMPSAFFGPDEASASINLGSVFLVVGALLAPKLADVLLRGTSFRSTLIVFGVVGLVPAVISLGITEDPWIRSASSAGGEDAPKIFDVILNPFVLLAAGVFFIYAPLEGAVSKWTVGYLRSLEMTESNVRRIESGFWACFLAGRLLTAAILHHRGLRALPAAWDPWILVSAAGAVCIAMGNLAGIVEKIKGALVVLMLGFFFGPILPTLIGMVVTQANNSAIPELPATAFGTVFALGSLGAILLVPLFDADAEHASAQKSLRVPIGLGVALMLLTLGFALLTT